MSKDQAPAPAQGQQELAAAPPAVRPQTQEEQDDQQPSRDRAALPRRLRTMRAQLLRGAATLAEDPRAALAEREILQAAERLLLAGQYLEDPERGE